jgi:hypothetical protein
MLFSNYGSKIIILRTLVVTIPNLEIFLFFQHNSTGSGNLELRQTIGTVAAVENSDTLTTPNFWLCKWY